MSGRCRAGAARLRAVAASLPRAGVAVEPGHALHDRGGALGRDVQVGPRPDQQPGGHAAGGERAVLLEGLLDEQVLPAAYHQDRDRDPLQRGAALQRSPERVAELRVLQPPLGQCWLAAEQVTHAGRDRQPVEHRPQPSFGRSRAHESTQHPGALLVSDQVAPADVVVQVEDAVAVRGPAEVMRAHVHDDRDQFRRRVHGQRPLHEPEVAGAVGDQPSVEPALLAQPGDSVLPVRDLVAHRLELPAGPESATAALHQHVVAAFGQDLRVLQAERAAAAVRAADQHGGRRRHADRQVVVGQQHHAVGHRHLDVALDRDPVPLRRQRPRPGQHLAERRRRRAQRAGQRGGAGVRALHVLLPHQAVLPATTTPAGTGSA